MRHKAMKLSRLAEQLGGNLVGDGEIEIYGVSGIEEAQRGHITFVANPKYRSLLRTTKASAVIVSRDVWERNTTLIQVDNPYFAFLQAHKLLAPKESPPFQGIDPRAVVEEGVELGDGVAVGAFVVIGRGTKIGAQTTIYPNVYIGQRCCIGEEVLIYPQVSIREKTEIGHRVIVQSGSVIGSDGFGYAHDKGVYYKIPQLGRVVIEDEVEIGANVTIDRATMGITRIGRGTKIDNLVHVGHNVEVGQDSIIVAQVGISGSTRVGKKVILAGQAGLIGHIHVGDGAMVGAQAGVTKSIPPGTIVSGYPARPHALAKRIIAHQARLPHLSKRVADLEKKMEKLKEGNG